MPVKELVRDAQVVLLGEPSHGDGSCFLAKAQLIQFLHQECGFDTLAFESGIYDCHRAWKAFRDGKDSIQSAELGIFPIWTGSQELTRLWTYLSATANSDRMLELIGFDCQFTGRGSHEFLTNDLRELARRIQLDFEPAQWSRFSDNLKLLVDAKLEECDGPYLKEVLSKFESSISLHADFATSEELRFGSQVIKNARNCLDFKLTQQQGVDSETINYRDGKMAENLLWYLREHPQRKVIVWAASFHILRHASRVRPQDPHIDYSRTIPMGEAIRETLGDRAFSIAFLAHEGKVGPWFRNPTALLPASTGTLEDHCMAAGVTNALIPLQNSNDCDWLSKPQWARPLGYSWMQATWPDHFDAFVFQQTMKPSTARQ